MIIPYQQASSKWTSKKSSCVAVSGRLRAAAIAADISPEKRMKYIERAARMQDCSNRIEYQYCPECGNLHISRTNLCRDRLCPVCAWRLSLQRMGQMMRSLEWIYEKDGNLNGAMLTLTVKNCPVDGLNAAIDELTTAWGRLRHRRKFGRWVKGYARSIEVTAGANGTLHPHLHVFVLWAAGYDKNIAQRELCDMWQESLQVEYTPICDIRRAYSRRSSAEDAWRKTLEAVAECTKYALSGKLMSNCPEDMIIPLAEGIKNRRLIAYGGSIAAARTALNYADTDSPTDVDDISIDCPKCGYEGCIPLALEWAAGEYRLALDYQ